MAKRTFTFRRALLSAKRDMQFLVCTTCRGSYHPKRLECPYCGTDREELAAVLATGQESDAIKRSGAYGKRINASCVPEGFTAEQMTPAAKPEYHRNSIGQNWKP